jgi:hypothetical protein
MQRFKPYQVPHKGFRSAIARLVTQAGSTDYSDDTDLATLRAATESVFASLDHHAHVEEEFILIHTAALKMLSPAPWCCSTVLFVKTRRERRTVYLP